LEGRANLLRAADRAAIGAHRDRVVEIAGVASSARAEPGSDNELS
jgi:hypothetical protein